MADTALRQFPGASRLLVHVGAGRSGRHVRSLTGASDWRRELADRAGAAVILAAGVAPLRATAGWAWPMCGADDLVEALRAELPGLRLLGAATPRQPGRQRLSLLGRAAGTSTVIKLGSGMHPSLMPGSTPHPAAGSLTTEAAVLLLLEANPLPGIATPRVLAAGTVACPDHSSPGRLEAIEFLATTSVAIGSQRAAIDAPLRTFTTDLAARLADLPRPADADPDAVPIHGDLTPWNLRRTRRGLALFDWESAGWGSPGFDLDTYRRSCDEIRPAWANR
jgi:hypothetical protein